MNVIRVFFDTNVLVYAHDESSSFHAESATLLTFALEANDIQGVIAEQNLIELYRILTNATAMKGNPLTALDASNLINSIYLNDLWDIIYPTRPRLNKTFELAVDRNIMSAKIFDIRLASLVLDADIDYFATHNIKDFQSINGIQSMTPREILVALANRNI
ncbi:MAG: PIN domain-containing protein [Nostocaceae cyanobacterium]|nr:PIN domain-containing protein [Nostocaceae cyanobacterium]